MGSFLAVSIALLLKMKYKCSGKSQKLKIIRSTFTTVFRVYHIPLGMERSAENSASLPKKDFFKLQLLIGSYTGLM
jgi:hypothetical protein